MDNAKDIDIAMSMYNLKEYSDNYSETFGSLWQCYRDEPNDNLADSESFKSKIKIGNIPANGNIGIDVYIPHRKYHVKPHSSLWFSAACAAAIAHINHFFRLYQKDKFSASKINFRQARNCCKRVLEAAKLDMLIKQKSLLLPRNLALVTFGKLPIVLSTKVNLLYFLCSMEEVFCIW